MKILTDVYPNFPWTEYFASFVPSNITITNDNKVLVHKDCNIYGLHELFAKSRSTVIMNYMLWRVVDRSILYLNEGMREIYYSLPGRYYERQARSMMCVSEVIQSLPMSARALCAKDYFPREAKAAAVELFSNIKTIFKNDYNKVIKIDKNIINYIRSRKIKKILLKTCKFKFIIRVGVKI